MAGDNRFQVSIATGRFTLPACIVLCLLLWVAGYESWTELATLGVCLLVAYVMVEMNTAFALIRTRTVLPVCIYSLLTAACLFLHAFSLECLAPLAFFLSLYQLCRSYESPEAPAAVFHAFLFLGVGSLVFPWLLYFVPLLFAGMVSFRSLSLRSFAALWLGLAAPYWFLFGHAFWHDEMELFYAPLRALAQWEPIDYSVLRLQELVSWAAVAVLSLVGYGYYFQVSYSDKIRTRIYLFFLIFVGTAALVFALLQPCRLYVWLPMQLFSASFILGHLFTLTRNRFSGIFFMVSFVIVLLLIFFNLWMRYFNS